MHKLVPTEDSESAWRGEAAETWLGIEKSSESVVLSPESLEQSEVNR